MRDNISARGFSLVEVTLALGVVAFCLITLLSLLPIGLQSYANSRQQLATLNWCLALESDLRLTPAGTNQTSPIFHVPIPDVGGQPLSITFYDTDSSTTNGLSLARVAGSTSRFALTLTPPPLSASNSPVIVTLSASWPAAASTNNPAGRVNLTVALNRNE